jgi:2-isopropylmalate synthase
MSTRNNKVFIFDTTLRDGEQSPGASMTLDEKLKIARVLEEMGVDIIEAGFPVASSGDFESVHSVSKMAKKAIICGLARANKRDIDKAAEALKPAPRSRIHTFISTSPLHMKHKLKMTPRQVHQAIIDSVSYARKFTDDVEWSCEDGSRSDKDFLFKCIETAIKSGAKTINIPDTVGYSVPEEFGGLIRVIMEKVPNIDKAIISVHCHNDLGLAVANSLAAIDNGARQVECTINGLGERAGNAAMEEIVMTLRTRHDKMSQKTGIDSSMITKASRMVSAITGFVVQPNKAIVGKNAFAHEAGIHQDGMLKHSKTYEIMTPESVGLNASTIVLGKHSGRHAFGAKLKELGYDLDQKTLNHTFKRFKKLADKKKELFEEDIVALVDDEIVRVNDVVKFISLQLVCGTKGPQKADITLEVHGKKKTSKATGQGPIDALFNAIKKIVPHKATLQLYQVLAVTEGADAQAEVSVRLEERGKSVNGQGADPDTMVASARAYVNALNKLLTKRKKSAPAALTA